MYYAATHHPKIIQKIFTNKTPPAGRTGGLSAVTLPFSHLKLGRKVSGDSPHKNLFAGEQDLSAIFINIHIN